MGWSKLKLDEVAVRRTELLKLRRQGARYDDDRVAALGYSSPDSARRDLSRALEAHRDAEAAEVSVYRQQENERLDALLQAVWPAALEGDPRAVDTALKISDRRAKLNGLDAPVRTELSGPDGGAVPLGNGSLAELHTLIGLNTSEDTNQETEGGDTDR